MVEVRIIYCRPCGFQDRAVKLANDVLRELGVHEVSVKLVPGDKGIFDVYVDDKLIFSRYQEKRFPEPGEIIDGVKKLLTPTP